MQWNIITQRDVTAANERLAPQSETTPPDSAGGAGGEGVTGTVPPGTPVADDFWNRLMKGIPLPIIGGYLAVTDILNSVTDDSSQSAREIVFWLVFLFFTIITPFFGRNVLKVTRKRQLTLSTAAFVIWAFALGGPFELTLSWWAPWMGGIAVICSAVLLMVIEPASDQDEPVPVPVPA